MQEFFLIILIHFDGSFLSGHPKHCPFIIPNLKRKKIKKMDFSLFFSGMISESFSEKRTSEDEREKKDI